MSAEQNGDIKNLNVKVRKVIFEPDQRRAVSFNMRLKTLLLGSGHLPLTVDCACSRCEQSCSAISIGCLSFVTLLEASSVSMPTSKIIFFSHDHDSSKKNILQRPYSPKMNLPPVPHRVDYWCHETLSVTELLHLTLLTNCWKSSIFYVAAAEGSRQGAASLRWA